MVTPDEVEYPTRHRESRLPTQSKRIAPMTARATLVLANHRPETIAAAQRLMARHDAVILEEPPDSQFLSMLNGQVPIDSYLDTQDLEYPEFSRRMAGVLRERHRAGVLLYQIEPFIDHLLAIHERFADGDGPFFGVT